MWKFYLILGIKPNNQNIFINLCIMFYSLKNTNFRRVHPCSIQSNLNIVLHHIGEVQKEGNISEMLDVNDPLINKWKFLRLGY